MTIKTQEYITDLLDLYRTENLESFDFWVFGSDSISETKTELVGSQKEKQNILESTIFGRKILSSDFEYMADFNLWKLDTIYDEYTDTEVLKGKKFFVITEPTTVGGDFEIFKCISNNNGGESTVKPVSNNTINNLDGIYDLIDGYIWKYMGSISNEKFNKFYINNKVPIVPDSGVVSIANSGIYSINITNGSENSGYERLSGTFVRRLSGSSTFIINTDQTFVSTQGHYVDRSLLVSKSSGSTKQYRITDSFLNGSEKSIKVEGFNSNDFNPLVGDTIQILPRIVISGDGSGAEAITIFNSDNNKIVDISILNSGSSYTSAVAEVLDAATFDPEEENSLEVRCEIEPVISPIGGHGSDIISELNSDSICISVDINSIVPSNIPDNNTYSFVSLVKSPEFSSNTEIETLDNRIKIELETSIPLGVTVGDVVTQTVNSVEISANIHEISGTDTIYLVNYTGPYQEEFTDSEPILLSEVPVGINTIEKPTYTQKSGKLLFSSSFTPVTRTEDKTEQIKFLLSF